MEWSTRRIVVAATMGVVLLALVAAVVSLSPVRPLATAGSQFESAMTSVSRVKGTARTVKGRITCLNNPSPVGVWIDATKSKDGWASIKVPYVPGGASMVDYSYRLNKGGKFKVNVGCGGTSERWGMSLSSPVVSGTKVNFRCNDIPPMLNQVFKRINPFKFGLSDGIKYGTCKKI